MVRSQSFPSVWSLRCQLADSIVRPLQADGDSSSDAVSVIEQHADLRPIPFVVVLVDDDSYKFVDQSTSGTQGPAIAQNFH